MAAAKQNERGWALTRRGPATLLVLLVLVVLTLAGLLGFEARATRLDSGITGLVLSGRACGDVKLCRGQRGVVVRVFEAASGDRVASVRTSPQGRFRIRLQPGRYVVRLVFAQTGGAPLKASRGVRVRPHRFAFVVVRVPATWGPGPRTWQRSGSPFS